MKVGKTAYLHYFLTALVLGLALSINSGAQGWAGGAVLLLLDLFGGGVIIVCALGLLGNLLTAVQRNRCSIGVHMAVGADTGDIYRLVLFDAVLKHAVLPVLLGSIGSQLLIFSGAFRLLGLPFPLPCGPSYAILCTLAALIFLVLCALYPAAAAARIQPVEVLKGD